MIKRRFYKVEHKDNSDHSDDSSSDSDSEVEPESPKDPESVNDAVTPDSQSSSVLGYESEDGSADVVDSDVPGSLVDEDVGLSGKTVSSTREDIHLPEEGGAGRSEDQSKIEDDEESIPSDAEDCVLKCKAVFRCRLCPRIVCLTDESIRAHLKSKRHARSAKLMREGRLKLMLNSDGEVEENEETHAERHSRILAIAEGEGKKKKNKGRQRQKKRKTKKKTETDSGEGKTKQSTEKPSKKRRKSGD